MDTASGPASTLIFRPWDDSVGATHLAVDSEFSRVVWLPILGPGPWVLWGTLGTRLAREPELSWRVDHLVQAHGFGRANGATRALARLGRFRLATTPEPALWLVRPSCPRLSATQLARSPGWVRSLHDRTFPPAPHGDEAH